jgi:hypothetical protein
MNKNDNKIKLFLIKNLLLESNLSDLEINKGIEIDHQNTLINSKDPVDKELFDKDIRYNSRLMSELYSDYFCLENTIRRQIKDVLEEKFGVDWWALKVPKGVKDEVIALKKREQDTVISVRGDNLLEYTHLGNLIDIINSNWADFSNMYRSQKAVERTLSDLSKVRNSVAHSCNLEKDEIIRFKLLIKDWLHRVQL